MPQSLRRHEMSWSRSSVNSLSSSSPRPASLQALQASKPPIPRPLPPSPKIPLRCRVLRVGQAAAAAILALRAADGAVGPFLNFGCPKRTNPGEYQCTPGTPFIVFEVWENVTPFVLNHSSQFRPGPPYGVNTKKYTADFNEVKSLGGDGISTPSARTADQTEIALFWWENSPLKWNRIARTVSVQTGLDLWEKARLFGLLNLALADGYIAMVDAKNHYNYWRPVTAIQTADTDGNPDTTGDPLWTPLRPTPPDQDYPSGHAIEGGAAAEVLKQFFGTDQISFQDCGVTLPAGSTCSDPSPVLRSYPASPRRRPRMRIRASSLGSTSANRSKKGPITVEKLASVPPISTSDLCTEMCGRWGGNWPTSLKGRRFSSPEIRSSRTGRYVVVPTASVWQSEHEIHTRLAGGNWLNWASQPIPAALRRSSST